MTLMLASDAQARLDGVSQKTGGMLPGIPFRGDSGRPEPGAICKGAFDAMTPNILLKNHENKDRRAGGLAS